MGRKPDPTGQSAKVCWGAMHVPRAVPFLWKAKQCVSAQCFILTGKTEAPKREMQTKSQPVV